MFCRHICLDIGHICLYTIDKTYMSYAAGHLPDYYFEVVILDVVLTGSYFDLRAFFSSEDGLLPGLVAPPRLFPLRDCPQQVTLHYLRLDDDSFILVHVSSKCLVDEV